jgi:3-dehydroquinate synthase class II
VPRSSARATTRSFSVRRARRRTSKGHDATSQQAWSSSSTSSTSSLPPQPLASSSPFLLPFRGPKTAAGSKNNNNKIVWVQPFTAEAAQAASEAGVRVLLFDERDAARAADFAGTLARFDAVVRFDDGLLADVTGRSVGTAVDLRTPADVRRAEALAVVGSGGGGLSPKSDKDDDDPSDPSSSSSPSSSPEQQSVVLADARDWAIIPAENLVAAFQEARRRSAASYDAAVRKSTQEEEEEEEGGRRKLPRRPRPTPKLLVTSATADGALALLGALESGVDGVVLRTGDPGEVRALCAAVGEAAAARASAFVEEKRSSENNTNDDNDGEIQFEVGVVSSVSPAGMGDRVCVDVTVLL